MGKSTLSLYILLARALSLPKLRPRFAYVAPLYRQAKSIAWDTLKHFARAIPGASINESELRIDFATNQGRIQLLGADNPDSLRGEYWDGVVLDEYAQMQPKAFREVVRPALADRQGWCIFIGTPHGKNHLYEVAELARKRVEAGDPHYSYGLYRASETGILSEDELASARSIMQEYEYEQEMECSFTAPVPGAFYQHEIAAIHRDGRIHDFDVDRTLPVMTAWDLGWNDTTAIWYFQARDGDIYFLDYDEESGVPLAPPESPGSHIDISRSWLARIRAKPYIYDHSRLPQPRTREPYELHYAPHDIEQHEWGYGKTRYGIALTHALPQLRLRFTPVQRIPFEDGIAATRLLLGRAHFHSRCAVGLDRLTSYRRLWDDMKQTYAEHAYHDKNSNGSDAMRYAAVGLQGELPVVSYTPPGGSFEWARKQAIRARDGRPQTTFRR
jgi:hypothetical protein